MSTQTKLNIFITGATGYIGGSVLSRLLIHPSFTSGSFQISALVRTAEKGEKLKGLGVRPVVGSYDDLDVLEREAGDADVVFSLADADALPGAKAILEGLKKRYERTGRVSKLIHTSGAAFVMDDARGLHGDHLIYSDLRDADAINALPDNKFHRHVDVPIIKADEEGYLRSYIIAPGNIFGTPSGPLVDLGIQNLHSILIPIFFKVGIARKQGGYIGLGKNVSPAADVEDTADLYLILFNALLANPSSLAHGREGIYFVENAEYTGYELAKATSDALVELGIGATREATAFTNDELELYFGKNWSFFSSNVRPRADRARALGWRPVKGKEALLASSFCDFAVPEMVYEYF
ncbi:uncharacterized protein LACBIDRAFT_333595 [Laccaria bicolor S238N-H82]|uniref:Predicted protein n=1 Tax=Laccaria bicolor (strain S238N-H82 / ATCC MYA-4686) TaxID=486041 RepID=B0DWG3_LACBS|nr:uncharacterized protein LACBIDRAFT_333595 [Laccaria bicolor S238N-H82]EDR01044.1 predicted protein [Laccaria bicolor S238N-H82]|eukprot:XP_001888263.1 predicted protein [Laccaria bicolor S238N-H82]